MIMSLEILKKFYKPFGTQPNGFETCLPLTTGENVSVLKKRNDFNQEKFVNFVLECINEGASIVGGCCEVSPEYISAINNKIFNFNK